MELVWRAGNLNYRKALNAYLNNLRVASVVYYTTRNCYQVICHLPGSEKCQRTFQFANDGQAVAQQIIDDWFKKATA